MKFKKKTTVVSGGKVFYLERGENKKEVIILLHGFPGNHLGLFEFARGLPDDYRILMPDFPGSGRSEMLVGKNILKNYADWLNAFIDALAIKNKVTIIGHSFGSRVAIVFTHHYQEKVKRLVLITPVIKADNLIDRITFLEYKITKLLPKNFTHILFSNRLYQRIVHTIISKYIMSRRRRKQIAERDFREYRHVNPTTVLDLSDEFYRTNLALLGKNINVHSIVIAGDKDIVANLNEIQELVSYLKNSELKIMQNTGHLAPVEKPHFVSKMVIDWLKGKSTIEGLPEVFIGSLPNKLPVEEIK